MKQNFTVRQGALDGVETFLAVAKHRSFRRAAAGARVTPSGCQSGGAGARNAGRRGVTVHLIDPRDVRNFPLIKCTVIPFNVPVSGTKTGGRGNPAPHAFLSTIAKLMPDR
jgi:hypothetical protein